MPSASLEDGMPPPLTPDVTLETLSRFQELKDLKIVDRRVVDVLLHDFQYDKMTDVQAKTIREAISGNDMYVDSF